MTLIGMHEMDAPIKVLQLLCGTPLITGLSYMFTPLVHNIYMGNLPRTINSVLGNATHWHNTELKDDISNNSTVFI